MMARLFVVVSEMHSQRSRGHPPQPVVPFGIFEVRHELADVVRVIQGLSRSVLRRHRMHSWPMFSIDAEYYRAPIRTASVLMSPPPYNTTVSQTLRQTLRESGFG